MQKLVVRRQGYGTALATLEFVELPTADNQLLRLYTTEADADTASRHAIARVLLAYSRLGVVMVGELPGHAIASALKPLHDDIIAGPWPNRNLLLLPLASASTLVTHGLDLGRGTGVAVRTTPQVARPADAWAFITGTWSRLREQTPADGRAVPELGAFKAGRLPAQAAAARHRPALGRHLADGRLAAAGRADDAADAGDRDAVVLADDAVDADRALRQAAERAERRHQLLRLRGRRAASRSPTPAPTRASPSWRRTAAR